MGPSYSPLNPLEYPPEDTTSPSPDQPLKENADPPHPAGALRELDPSETHPSMFLLPSRNQPFRRGPSASRPNLWSKIRMPLEMALLPLAAIAYLAFCYTVHGKAVPVNTHGLYSVTTQHLATIKGGITAINIIIISIALYPVYDIMATLKSEEFFRALASHIHGVPLETINHISNPSFGHISAMMAVWRNRCSNYYILGIVASLLAWTLGTLAPGALTVDSVLADGELVAFAIGAVLPQSVLNGTDILPTETATLNAGVAASITWAEMELGVQYSFGVANTSEPEYAAFIVPAPLNLSTTTAARWLSDVIGINPTCSWASTNITIPVQIPDNTTSSFDPALVTAYLPEHNLDVEVTNNDIDILVDSAFATFKTPSSSVKNHTTQAVLSDGSAVFLLGQCRGSGCSVGSTSKIMIDLTDVNTTFTLASSNQTWTMAVLACNPNVKIETREVRNDGHGLLTVQPLPAGRQLTRQGNLNPIQATALFSIAPSQLSQYAGQLTATQGSYSQLGAQVQGELLFGKEPFDNLPGINSPFGPTATISPAPIENITQIYTQILRSCTKPYLAGYLGTAYVPGRVSASEAVFASSIPNLAVSTAVFALLVALIATAHFRPGKGVEFTLTNVAAAVHGSELPAQFAQIQAGHADEHADTGVEGDAETANGAGEGRARPVQGDVSGEPQDVVEVLGERRIFMRRRADGSPVLHIG